jgi:hypothetical protein
MVYTKSRAHESQDVDDWHAWLISSEIPSEEYNLTFSQDSIQVEFYDLDRAQAFALEFAL